MNPAISNLILMGVMMQVSRKLDMEDPTIIFYIRCMYVTCITLTFAIYFYTKMVIKKKNDLTTLKYVSPPSPMSGETKEKLEVTTVRDYDLKQVDAAMKSIYSGLAMSAFMHLYMKYTNPLLMQSLSPLKGAIEANIVKIHLFGSPATGDLKRPFKEQSMFGSGPEVKTDKKSIEEAEKAGLGGIKSE